MRRNTFLVLLLAALAVTLYACGSEKATTASSNDAPLAIITTHSAGSTLHRSKSMLDPVTVGVTIAPAAQGRWFKMDYAWSYQLNGAKWHTFAVAPPVDGKGYVEINWWNTEDLADVTPGTTLFIHADLYMEDGQLYTTPSVAVMVTDPVWPPSDQCYLESQIEIDWVPIAQARDECHLKVAGF